VISKLNQSGQWTTFGASIKILGQNNLITFEGNSTTMALGEFLKPVNERHSIKECVVTLFLATPILKPASFKNSWKPILLNT
jgi:aspartate-semialdehyde dehydrogenase